jgi:hypothetical protein
MKRPLAKVPFTSYEKERENDLDQRSKNFS